MPLRVPPFLRRLARAAVFFVVLGALARPAAGRPGDPDLRFGTGGVVRMPAHPSFPLTTVADLAVQGDGKIVAAGATADMFHVARFRADGTLDPDFGTDGSVTVSTFMVFSSVFKVAVQPDGMIVVAGFAWALASADLVIRRFLPDGRPDPSFGNDGRIVSSQQFESDFGGDLALLSNGSMLVLASGRFTAASPVRPILLRFFTDGTPDAGFGGGGLVPVADPWYRRMAVQPDGKVVLGGSESDGILVRLRMVRYDAEGRPDTTFGSSGRVTGETVPNMALQFRDIALQSDGKILVAGVAQTVFTTKADFLLCRFHANGSPDLSFNGTGRVVTDVSTGTTSTDEGRALVVQSDGKPVVAGKANEHFSLVRYLPDGSLDPAFGNGGIFNAGPVGSLSAMALQPDGKIVTGGGRVLARTLARPQPVVAEWPDDTTLTFGKTVDFASVPKGNPPVQTTVTLTNTGEAPVTGLTAAFEGPDASRFTVLSALPATLGGLASVPVTLQFSTAPQVGTFEAVLSITTDTSDIDGVAFRVRASTVLPFARLVVFDDQFVLPGGTVDFGLRIPSQGPATRTLTLKNEGNIDLTLQGITLGAAGTPGDFTLQAPATEVLVSGAETPLPVTFTSGGPGERTAILRIASTDTFNPPYEIHLKATMAAGLDAFRLTYFGTVDNFSWPSADSSDADRDGLWNMLEYALMTNPIVPNPTPWELVKNGDVLEFTITRPSDAEQFVGYALQWSVSPDTGPWFFSYEEPVILSDDGTRQRVMFPVHAGFSGRRFVRLQVQKRPG